MNGPPPGMRRVRGSPDRDHEYEYYVVFDFEATCCNRTKIRTEIIEFAAVIIDAKTLKQCWTFSTYVRPILNPKLFPFCMKITGIDQQSVDSAPTFMTVFAKFEEFLTENIGSNFAVVTDGPNDLKMFLRESCSINKIDFPSWAEEFIDVKKFFGKEMNAPARSLAKMLEALNMVFVGRPHSGIDDARNIADVLKKLVRHRRRRYVKLGQWVEPIVAPTDSS